MRSILRQNLVANRIGNVTLMARALGAFGAPPDVETVDELRLERLDWLKLDDGATALVVLQGATDTLWRLRPLVFAAAADESTLSSLAELRKGTWLSLLAHGDVFSTTRRISIAAAMTGLLAERHWRCSPFPRKSITPPDVGARRSARSLS